MRVKTIVTFADFFRNVPLVLDTEADTFFILCERNEIRLCRRPISFAGSFGLVLQVDCHFSKCREPQQLPVWRLEVHEESSCGLFKIEPDDGGLDNLSELHYFRPGEAVDYVEAGEVFGFSMDNEDDHPLLAFDTILRVMFSLEEEPEDALSRNPRAPHILNLPDEVLRLIVSFLPFHAITDSACFLSQRFFDAAKSATTEWPILDMTKGIKSVKDLMTLCEVAHTTCTRIKGALCHVKRIRGEDALLNPCGTRRWPKVEKLDICPEERFDADNFHHALTSGLFPQLKSLTITPSLPWIDSFHLRHLGGWNASHLRRLTISLQNFREMPVEESNEIMSQFCQLERLHLCVPGDPIVETYSSDSFISKAFTHGHLQGLKELKVMGHALIRCMSNEVPEEPFSGPMLERLSLVCKQAKWKSLETSVVRVDAAGLLNHGHPNLKTLNLSNEILLTEWASVQATSLGNLTELSIAVASPVPYTLMPNLEAARIHLLPPALEGENIITELLTLPKLKTLTLDGPSGFQRLVKDLCATSQVKNLTFTRSRLKLTYASDMDGIRAVLQSMPALVRLQVQCTEINCPDIVGVLLKSFAINLQSMVIVEHRVHGEPRASVTTFKKSVTKLFEVMSGGWKMKGPKTINGRQEVNIFRPGEHNLDQKDLCRFERDSFFANGSE